MNAVVFPTTAAVPTTVATTAAEFEAMLDALNASGFRFELEKGTIIRKAPAGSDHSDQHSDLHVLIAPLVRADCRANIDLGVVVARDTVRGPDIVVRRRGEVRPGKLIDAAAAELVIEVADTTIAKDLGIKASDYAAAGIPKYWIVDVTARVIHVLTRPAPEGYASRIVVPFGQPLTAACLTAPLVFEG